MTLQEFVTAWDGRPVDFDGSYPNQCMDLMHQYVYDVLGSTDRADLAAPAAKDVYNSYPNGHGDQNFLRIANRPDNVPQPGDLIFWNETVGKYGHVAIFLSGSLSGFTSFDANWPLGSLPHRQSHNYAGVLGWLRFKADPTLPTTNAADMSQQEHDELDHLREFRRTILAAKRREYRVGTAPEIFAILQIPNFEFFSQDLEMDLANVRTVGHGWDVCDLDAAIDAAQKEEQLQVAGLNQHIAEVTGDAAKAAIDQYHKGYVDGQSNPLPTSARPLDTSPVGTEIPAEVSTASTATVKDGTAVLVTREPFLVRLIKLLFGK